MSSSCISPYSSLPMKLIFVLSIHRFLRLTNLWQSLCIHTGEVFSWLLTLTQIRPPPGSCSWSGRLLWWTFSSPGKDVHGLPGLSVFLNSAWSSFFLNKRTRITDSATPDIFPIAPTGLRLAFRMNNITQLSVHSSNRSVDRSLITSIYERLPTWIWRVVYLTSNTNAFQGRSSRVRACPIRNTRMSRALFFPNAAATRQNSWHLADRTLNNGGNERVVKNTRNQ